MNKYKSNQINKYQIIALKTLFYIIILIFGKYISLLNQRYSILT